MTESEFIQQALHLKEKTYGLRVSLDRMRRALEFLSGKLQNKNDYEAQSIYNRYWHQYSSDFHVFGKNYSEYLSCCSIRLFFTQQNFGMDIS